MATSRSSCRPFCEVFESLEPVVEKHPEYEKAGVLERLVEPESAVKFRVA